MVSSNVDFKVKTYVGNVQIVEGWEKLLTGYLECLYDFGYIDKPDVEKYLDAYCNKKT